MATAFGSRQRWAPLRNRPLGVGVTCRAGVSCRSSFPRRRLGEQSALPAVAHRSAVVWAPLPPRRGPNERDWLTECRAAAAQTFSHGHDHGHDPGVVLARLAEALTTLFPLWVCIGVAVGLARPSAVTWFTSDLFTMALGFLMLSMGLTLTFQDFKDCVRRPVPVVVGFFAQYIVKPMLGFALAKGLCLSPPLATGLILVACCPGGQSSNVATYIANGDVALSVLMTTASTMGAILMTPLLTKLLAGTLVPVDAMGLAVSTLQVVLLPTLVGVTLNEVAHNTVKKITPILPLVGVFLTTILTASPVGQSAAILRVNGLQLLLPTFLLHAVAFPAGYVLSKLMKFSEKESRTVSIETGMQSSALGFLLAQRHFSDPLVMVPSAVSVLFQAGLGSALAVMWRNLPIKDVILSSKRASHAGEKSVKPMPEAA